MADQVFTIGTGRSGTKSMSVILSTVFPRSFHEYDQLVGERRRSFLDMNYKGRNLLVKIKKYRRMGVFHDSDNCNTMFIHHLCKAFPDAKILLPIGSLHSFVRAHRAWGIMEMGDKNINTRAFHPQWDKWPIVVKLAWLWGKRNVEAIRRSDKNRLMIFKISNVTKELPKIFKFIDKPISSKAIRLSRVRHNKLNVPSDKVARVEHEMFRYKSEINKVTRPFIKIISRHTNG